MIPTINEDSIQDFIVGEIQTSRTYKLDMEKQSIRDFTDEGPAMVQAIYKILNTERYRHSIYSWNYGVELAGLIGRPTSYALPEIKRRIMEGLMQDDRIQGVSAFSFEVNGGMVKTEFTVHTIFGDIAAEKEVG